MKNEKKQLQNEKAKMEKLEARRAEMWVRQETARGELGDAKKLFGKELVDGGDVEELSAAVQLRNKLKTVGLPGFSRGPIGCKVMRHSR